MQKKRMKLNKFQIVIILMLIIGMIRKIIINQIFTTTFVLISIISTWIILTGIFLNHLVMSKNKGKMPVLVNVTKNLGFVPMRDAKLREYKLFHSEEKKKIRLWWLGDIISIKRNHKIVYISVGDILLYTGFILISIIWLLF